ncbi:2Fe-2S iron-sulfur cluster binding domain protein (plasmid) [Ochrobactrum quorumnocens]|uniref:2Fe-2S iron-sulfur cluster binding domain protein n=1 Tax=Ochrobactrum quorumnocens TaxID=271865 RepID=A0A248UQ87_9HYPH|nr:(2Fe-2S)-binding protein [[Ochrobactrum] quorumnocens]ASV88762.1 2Fe-2S iron-sulfur cluster binding domain protein [[Ochrobactrum] quorumnocens]
MFRQTEKTIDTVAITFDGMSFDVGAGQTVAAALLAQGINALRNSVVGNQPRAPYCLMGVCFECLVQIDGVENRQACMTVVREGMSISSQTGARNSGRDL